MNLEQLIENYTKKLEQLDARIANTTDMGSKLRLSKSRYTIYTNLVQMQTKLALSS